MQPLPLRLLSKKLKESACTALVLDSPKFAFRNDKQGAGPCAKVGCMWGQLCYYFANHTLRPQSCQAHPDASRQAGGSCLAGACADETVWNVGEEIAELADALPAGRSLKVSFYATGHSSLGTPTARCKTPSR